MRIQCDVCEKAEAALVCCADEAALCAACDSQVHAANKLAGKHQRLPLIPPGPNESPSCDICQEKTGWFFCVEDRALLCRGCDVSIHTSNTLASTHKRFLVTGLKVALNALSAQDFLDAQSQHSSHNSLSPQKTINTNNSNLPVFGASSSVSPFNRTPERFETRTEVDNGVEKRTGSTISDYLTESVPGWRVDELLNIPDLASGYTLADVQSSKADAANLGEFDWLADLSLFEEQTYAEAFHEVPEMTFASTMGYSKTAPTKGKAKLNMAIVPEADDSLLVPDMALPPAKRARTFFTL